MNHVSDQVCCGRIFYLIHPLESGPIVSDYLWLSVCFTGLSFVIDSYAPLLNEPLLSFHIKYKCDISGEGEDVSYTH